MMEARDLPKAHSKLGARARALPAEAGATAAAAALFLS